MPQNLTIIIVSFNSSKIISSCLEKIAFSKHRVVVVDNASSDNTVEVIKKSFPHTEVIKLDKNIGYGRANNVALRTVTSKYAMILNPDAFIAEDDIEKMLHFLDKNEDVALSGPLLLSNYPASQQDIDDQLKVVDGNLIEKCSDYFSVKYIIGAVLFMRMSVFNKIGFFDEEIFLYYEDDEISHRVVKNGYKAAIFAGISGYHIGHGSSGTKLRGIYKRFWHRAFSKLNWKKKQKGMFCAVKSGMRLSLVFFVRGIFYLVTFNPKKFTENIASMCGSLSFLLGMKAFDKNDNPRG